MLQQATHLYMAQLTGIYPLLPSSPKKKSRNISRRVRCLFLDVTDHEIETRKRKKKKQNPHPVLYTTTHSRQLDISAASRNLAKKGKEELEIPVYFNNHDHHPLAINWSQQIMGSS
jgi:hypothetical protein